MSIVAIVPAAGLSVRMGRPKLTLPLRDKTVIAHVVETLLAGGADRVLCVVRPHANPESDRLTRETREAGAEVSVCDPPPPDMRASVEHGIALLEAEMTVPAGILLCPADSPGLSEALVRQVTDTFAADPSRLVLPQHSGKRGHPVAIPWDLALAIRELPMGEGINALHVLHDARRVFLPITDGAAAFADLDTPQDYQAWQERLESRRPTP